MCGIDRIARQNPDLATKLINQGYCLQVGDLAEVVKIERLMPILVKCGCGRFTAPAQDVGHFIRIIGEHAKLVGRLQKNGINQDSETDYVRSVELDARF